MGKSGSTDRPSLSLAPLVVGPYVNGSEWYVAAWFTFSKYDQRIQGSNFILGGGSKTVDLQDVVYTNRPLESGMTYSVYCRAVGKDSTGGLIQSTSDGVAFLTTGDSDSSQLLTNSENSGHTHTNVIIGAVVPSIIFVIVVIVLLAVVKRHIRNLEARVANYETQTRATLELDDRTQHSMATSGTKQVFHGGYAYDVPGPAMTSKEDEICYEEISAFNCQREERPYQELQRSK
jgi:hypothetical protein